MNILLDFLVKINHQNIFLKNKCSRQNLRFLTFLSTFLLLILFKPSTAGAVSIVLNNTQPTIVSGTDCGIATYRFGTTSSFNGQALDLLVEVLSEDNDLVDPPNAASATKCISSVLNTITVDIRDRDAVDNLAFMDLKVTVVAQGTTTPVPVDRLSIAGFDLDINTAAAPNSTGTDDVYFQTPDGTYISSGSNVTATTGTFFGQYQTKLKGQTTGDCTDSPTATPTAANVACRGAGIFVNGPGNVPNTVSSVRLRVQNDNAYGDPVTNAANLRRFQLSLEISEVEELLNGSQDFGDAATSYLSAGAAVTLSRSLGYGVPPDAETNNQFSATANGDDIDGSTNASKFDDEDGVRLNNLPLDNQTVFTHTPTNLSVTTFGTGFLSAWLDLNKNGVFDTTEKVLSDLQITNPSVLTSVIPITIPGTATAGNTAIRFRFSAATGVGATGLTATGEVEDYQIAIARYDYGDAPSSFGDASHDIPVTPNVYLGGVKPDKELGTQLGADAGASAAGDDGNGTPDDEDAFTTLANVSTVGNYNLTVPVTNTSGGAATLHAWIDFNKNGQFELGEYKSVAVVSGGTSASLNWTVPTGTLPGSTHARFRLTTDNTLTDNGGTSNVDERSIGNASNGEVEDYPVSISVPIYDYGDAPDTAVGTGTSNYQTTASDGGAAQVVIKTLGQVLSLGSNIDTDDGSLQNATADADDNSGTPDDEDGVSNFPTLTTTANQTYIVPVSVQNNVPLLNAFLVGYIDFNKDGDFLDPGEKSTTVTVPTDSSNPRTLNVTFTTPAGMTTGNTYARFRLGSIQATAESATGASAGTDNGEIEDYQISISAPSYDYGDAPSSYGDASHDFPATPTIYLGSIKPDKELGTQLGTDAGAAAAGDDNNGDDEDAFTTLANVSTIDNYDIIVPVSNTSGSNATLHAWVDFDKDGKFEVGEYQSATVANNSTSANLNWQIPSGTTAGDTYIRFRLTADSLTDDNATSNQDERSIGNVTNGEVEDYKVAIEPVPSLPPSSVGSCEVSITNGSFENPALTATSPTPHETFVAKKIAAYNENDVPGWTSFADSYIELWRNGNNIDGNPPAHEGEQFAEINAYVNGSLYQDVATTPGSVMTWQFAHRGRAGTDTMNLKVGSPGATVAQINSTNGTTSFQTGNTAWVVYQGTYTVPLGQTTTRFEYKAVSTASGSQGAGNFIDAVRFGPLCDHGDAKSDYPVLRSNNGAAHINDGVTFLGSKVRIELDGQPSAAADGDDGIVGDVDQIDDEDGVTFSSTLNTGRISSVDVVASVPGYLNAWIDFNQNNNWNDPGEKVFTDTSLNAGINNLSFTIPANANIGDTFARFRFGTNTGINPTGIVASGEVEDYQIAIAAASDPNLLLVKRITAINPGKPEEILFSNFVDDFSTSNDNQPLWPDPDLYLQGAIDAGKVKPGDEVEYTVYFLSSGDVNAKEVKICDVVPDQMTFVKNTYGIELGIGLGFDSTGLPTLPNLKLSNLLNDDQGDFYGPGTAPPTNLCKKVTPANTLINVNGINNDNGAVVVKIPNLPKADSPGNPTNSYGFIRFRAKVK
jgi:uncharacterized repeat protein (TIGR01451 family)